MTIGEIADIINQLPRDLKAVRSDNNGGWDDIINIKEEDAEEISSKKKLTVVLFE